MNSVTAMGMASTKHSVQLSVQFLRSKEDKEADNMGLAGLLVADLCLQCTSCIQCHDLVGRLCQPACDDRCVLEGNLDCVQGI